MFKCASKDALLEMVDGEENTPLLAAVNGWVRENYNPITLNMKIVPCSYGFV
jgi:hypothetical protein